MVKARSRRRVGGMGITGNLMKSIPAGRPSRQKNSSSQCRTEQHPVSGLPHGARSKAGQPGSQNRTGWRDTQACREGAWPIAPAAHTPPKAAREQGNAPQGSFEVGILTHSSGLLHCWAEVGVRILTMKPFHVCHLCLELWFSNLAADQNHREHGGRLWLYKNTIPGCSATPSGPGPCAWCQAELEFPSTSVHLPDSVLGCRSWAMRRQLAFTATVNFSLGVSFPATQESCCLSVLLFLTLRSSYISKLTA